VLGISRVPAILEESWPLPKQDAAAVLQACYSVAFPNPPGALLHTMVTLGVQNRTHDGKIRKEKRRKEK
jgi:hypothetical protein